MAATDVGLALATGDTPAFVSAWLPAGLLSGLAFGRLMTGVATSAAAALPPQQFAWFDRDATAAAYRELVGTLADGRRTVVVFTMFEVTRVITYPEPFGSRLDERYPWIQGLVRDVARDLGCVLVDFGADDVPLGLDMWSADRLHLNARGHAVAADVALRALAERGGVTRRRLVRRPDDPRGGRRRRDRRSRAGSSPAWNGLTPFPRRRDAARAALADQPAPREVTGSSALLLGPVLVGSVPDAERAPRRARLRAAPTEGDDPMVLLSYDGSDDARAALDHAARVLPGATATVLTVWTPEREYEGAHGPGLGLAGMYAPDPEADAAREREAQACAEEGAELARAAGLVAEAAIRPRHDAVATAILAAADEVGADVIVLGSRGLGGVKSFLLGSVSHGVLQQADRPVMVVPSRAVARQRRDVIRAAVTSSDSSDDAE